MAETTSKQGRNKGGAPRGNLNAMKHGMYSASLKAKTKNADEATEADSVNLAPEIELLRVLINRAVRASQEAEGLTEVLQALRIISLAEYNLTRLMRAQNVFATVLSRAPAQADVEMAEIMSEMAKKVDELGDMLEMIGEEEYERYMEQARGGKPKIGTPLLDDI